MQYIQEDGTKRFAKDSRKEGCFHAVGGMDALARAPALVISEGYATAATNAEVIGFATVAAFDAGNLLRPLPWPCTRSSRRSPSLSWATMTASSS
jgi:putative DNA primase/helicase